MERRNGDSNSGRDGPVDELYGGIDEPPPFDAYDELLEEQEVEKAAQRARALAAADGDDLDGAPEADDDEGSRAEEGTEEEEE